MKPGLPAEKAGVLAGDEIVAANDIAIVGTPGGKLSDLMENAKPGDHLKLRVHRGSAEQVWTSWSASAERRRAGAGNPRRRCPAGNVRTMAH